MSVRLSTCNRFKVRIGRVPAEIRAGRLLNTNQAPEPAAAKVPAIATTTTTITICVSTYQHRRKTLGRSAS
jgi:hypothetical protein